MTGHVYAYAEPAKRPAPDATYRDLVHPVLVGMGLVPAGELLHMEGTNQDARLGIDWMVSAADGTQHAIGARTQWDRDYGTFTMRYRTAKGNLSELAKRARSVAAGGTYPDLTVQAYVDWQRGIVLNAYVARTDDLYRHVVQPSSDGNEDHFRLCSCASPPRWAPGGAQYVAVAITEEGRVRIGTKATLVGHGVPVRMLRQRHVGQGFGL